MQIPINLLNYKQLTTTWIDCDFTRERKSSRRSPTEGEQQRVLSFELHSILMSDIPKLRMQWPALPWVNHSFSESRPMSAMVAATTLSCCFSGIAIDMSTKFS